MTRSLKTVFGGWRFLISREYPLLIVKLQNFKITKFTKLKITKFQ